MKFLLLLPSLPSLRGASLFDTSTVPVPGERDEVLVNREVEGARFSRRSGQGRTKLGKPLDATPCETRVRPQARRLRERRKGIGISGVDSGGRKGGKESERGRRPGWAEKARAQRSPFPPPKPRSSSRLRWSKLPHLSMPSILPPFFSTQPLEGIPTLNPMAKGTHASPSLVLPPSFSIPSSSLMTPPSSDPLTTLTPSASAPKSIMDLAPNFALFPQPPWRIPPLLSTSSSLRRAQQLPRLPFLLTSPPTPP